MDYDVDPIAKCIADYWNADDPETAWANYKQGFAVRPKAERVTELKKIDSYFGGEDAPLKATREVAAMLRRKRELEDVHWTLDRIGK